MEVYLCEKGCGHCPKVKVKSDVVEIGEEGNLVRLNPNEWNILVKKIKADELVKIE